MNDMSDFTSLKPGGASFRSTPAAASISLVQKGCRGGANECRSLPVSYERERKLAIVGVTEVSVLLRACSELLAHNYSSSENLRQITGR
jgi:hypothetical protein